MIAASHPETLGARLALPAVILFLAGAATAVGTRFSILAYFCGGLAVFLLAAVVATRPALFVLSCYAISLLVPIELGISLGGLPRLGPTRLILLAVCLGALPLVWHHRTELAYGIGRPILYLGLLSIIVSLAQTPGSVDSSRSLYTTGLLVLEQVSPVLLVGACTSRYPNFPRRLGAVVVGCSVCVCVFALIEFTFKANPLLPLFGESDIVRGVYRVRSVFFHPICLGSFLGMTICWTVGLKRERPGGHLLSCALLLQLAILGLTVSRGPLLAAVLELGIVAALALRRNRSLVLVACGLLLLTGMATTSLVRQFGRTSSALDQLRAALLSEDTSEFYRIALWQAVLDRLSGTQWLTGTGPGTFHVAAVESVYDGHYHVLTAPDSHIARVLLEQGVPGLVTWIMLLVAVGCRLLLRAVDSSGGVAPWTVPALAATAGLFTCNVFASMQTQLPLAVTYWSLVALGLFSGGGRDDSLTKPVRLRMTLPTFRST